MREVNLGRIKANVLSLQELGQLLLKLGSTVPNVALQGADLLAKGHNKILHVRPADSVAKGKRSGLDGTPQRGAHHDRDAVMVRELAFELAALGNSLVRENGIANEMSILHEKVSQG